MIIGLPDINLNALTILAFIDFYIKWCLWAGGFPQGED